MEINEKQKRFIYYFIVLSLFITYVNYVPFLLDYYMIRPEEGLFTFMFQNPDLASPEYVFEEVIIGSCLISVYLLAQNSAVAFGVTSVALFVLTHASHLKYLNRREILRLGDLKLTEAAGIALAHVKFTPDGYLFTILGVFAVFILAGWGAEHLNKKKQEQKQSVSGRKNRICSMGIRLGTVVLCCVAVSKYANYFFYQKMAFDVVEIQNVVTPEPRKFVLYRFLENDSLPMRGIDQVEEIYAGLLEQIPVREESGEVVKPHIIVIMNESWWNTDQITSDQIRLSGDPMEPCKRLQKEGKCTLGYLTSNVFGGGTVSSEVEFLTGLNTKYYVHETVYNETLGRKLPSVMDYLHALNYETTAIHPYYGEFYDRAQTYQEFGFDRIIFEDGMNYKDLYTYYISDESLADQIIQEYDQKNEKPQFIWSVSVGNHKMGLEYDAVPKENPDFPISVDIGNAQMKQEDYYNLVSYMNGIYWANSAFEQLVDYFEVGKEPVILIMYGDHIPDFSADALNLMGLSSETDDVEIVRKCQSVPCAIWSNLEESRISALQLEGEGIYYLPGMLFEKIDFPDTDLMRIQRLERSLFRANTRRLALDAEGNVLEQCTSEQVHILDQVKTINYDLFFGEQKCKDIWDPVYGSELK